MKIILIGFMGSGKSTVGQCLAQFQNMRFYETDALALARSTRASISDIFTHDGEPVFRAYEREIADQLSHLSAGVIATGGGMVTQKVCIDALRQNGGVVIYLHAAFELLQTRVLSDHQNTRPLFQKTDKARALYDARLDLYHLSADHVLPIHDKKPEEIAREIAQLVMRKEK
jgi:shikimate kinase